MPRSARRSKRKSSGKRRGRGRQHKKADISMSYHANKASIVETFDVFDLSGNTPYNAQFSLSQFNRALVVASQYQWYRATKVEWSYEPFYDTFQDGITPATVPQLFWQMNRSGENNVGSRADLERMGAIPKKFTKNIVIAYKPQHYYVNG